MMLVKSEIEHTNIEYIVSGLIKGTDGGICSEAMKSCIMMTVGKNRYDDAISA